MTRKRRILAAVLAAAVLSGCSPRPQGPDVLYQTSTLGALLAGVYDGEVTVAELTAHGDFGLGTFNALDGEMIVLEGRTWQIKADGKAYPAGESMKTPFAAVTFFRAGQAAALAGADSLAELCESIDALLPSRDLPYAVRVDGRFRQVKVRSVPRQTRPYRGLAEVVKDQATFELRDVRGVLAGFRLPGYVEGVNVPGYHFHFLTADRSAGGHVLDCRLEAGKVRIDRKSALHVSLPAGGELPKAEITGRERRELQRVEK